MKEYSFNEKQTEWYAKLGEEIPVFKTPKYREAKKKAIEIIESKKYGVTEADFWILMNATKNKKMAYNGLIISHNGCLKINDNLDSKFNPESVWHDKEGYGNSLVFHYADKEQGIYEVGEISKSNCQNEYPYAMAFKRLFDRVVLKLSKLAYNGIYSDSESDEFAQHLEAGGETLSEETASENNSLNGVEMFVTCDCCDAVIDPVTKRDGTIWHVADMVAYSKQKYGKALCGDCMKAESKKK